MRPLLARYELAAVIIFAVCLSGLSLPASAQPLFTENFDALGAAHGEFGLDHADSAWEPGIDTPSVDTSSADPPPVPQPCIDDPPPHEGCEGAVTRLVDLGGGDWCLYLSNYSFGPNGGHRSLNGIRSKMGWPRGNNLRVTFQMFGDPAISPDGEPYPLAGGPMGPWHQREGNDFEWTDSFNEGNIERDIEAGLNIWAGWQHYFEENGGPNNDRTGRELLRPQDGDPPGYRAAVVASALSAGTPLAQQKANGSIWCRVWLGDVTGGTMEYSVDSTNGTDGTWESIRQTGLPGNPVIDTRGDNPQPNIGNTSPVYLGFGAFKHACFDNIFVEDDITGVTPTPTPTPTVSPTPTPTPPPDPGYSIIFSEDFNVLGETSGEFGLGSAGSLWNPGVDTPSVLVPGVPVDCPSGTNEGCAGAVTRLVHLGSGDWALYLSNYSFGPVGGQRSLNGIRSKQSWPRGMDMRVTFRMFGDPAISPDGEPYPRAGGPMGPWHQTNDWQNGDFAGNIERDIEMGLNQWAGWRHFFEENGGPENDSTGIFLENDDDDGDYLAVARTRVGATSAPLFFQKSDFSMWVRFILGDQTGGKMQYSLDGPGGTWLDVHEHRDGVASIGPVIDTRGMPAGDTIGSAPEVFLGFGAFKHACFDDIRIEVLGELPNPAEHWELFE